jgi:hypothetical protein
MATPDGENDLALQAGHELRDATGHGKSDEGTPDQRCHDGEAMRSEQLALGHETDGKRHEEQRQIPHQQPGAPFDEPKRQEATGQSAKSEQHSGDVAWQRQVEKLHDCVARTAQEPQHRDLCGNRRTLAKHGQIAALNHGVLLRAWHCKSHCCLVSPFVIAAEYVHYSLHWLPVASMPPLAPPEHGDLDASSLFTGGVGAARTIALDRLFGTARLADRNCGSAIVDTGTATGCMRVDSTLVDSIFVISTCGSATGGLV